MNSMLMKKINYGFNYGFLTMPDINKNSFEALINGKKVEFYNNFYCNSDNNNELVNGNNNNNNNNDNNNNNGSIDGNISEFKQISYLSILICLILL